MADRNKIHLEHGAESNLFYLVSGGDLVAVYADLGEAVDAMLALMARSKSQKNREKQ